MEKKYFDNEITGGLISNRRSDHTDMMAGDFMNEVEVKFESSVGDRRAQKPSLTPKKGEQPL